MLSTGKWHERVPKSLRENLRFRIKLIQAVRRHGRLAVAAIVRMCREDIYFFINCFVWQYNGKKRGSEVGPFVTWDFQDEAVEELLRCINEGKDCIIEKSRDMGASWLCLIVVLWVWLFHPWKTLLCISRNEKAVEDENPESLFWKLDFIISYLPGWLLQGYTERVHRRKLYFGHPNGSSIYGQASTGQAGVGGKCTFMFIDEFSQIKEDHEVLHRTSDTTDCRIFNGTHLGMDTAFYELTDPESVAGSYVRKIRMHWTQHPDKSRGLYRSGPIPEAVDANYAHPADYGFVRDGTPTGGPHPGVRSPWYDDQCKRKGNARAVAMDLDINPSGSVSQVFDVLVIRDLIARYAIEPYWEGELEFDRFNGQSALLVPRERGRVKLWVAVDDGRPPLGKYAIGCDPSQGSGATASCVTVINAETGDKVLEYADPFIDPTDLGYFLVSLAWLFKAADGSGAALAWEIPGPGQTVGKVVTKDLGYRNVFFKPPQKLSGVQTDIPGWTSMPNSKMALLNEYHKALKARQFLNRSKVSLEECLKFKYSSSGVPEHSQEASPNDPSGARVNHGDRVIADALAWLMGRSLWIGRVKKVEEEAPILSMQWRRNLRKKQEEEAWG